MTTVTTRAVTWMAFGEPLRIEELPAPRVELEHDLVIQVHAAHFGSALRRAVNVGHPKITPPRVLGSLVAGVVRDAGSDAPARRGDRVVVDPHPPCGNCKECVRGLQAVCRSTALPEPGGLSELVRVRTTSAAIAVVPSHLSFAEAVHAELLACVIEALERGGVRAGKEVIVIGSGALAFLAVQASRVAGAQSVTSLSRRPERAAIAARLGARVLTTPADARRADIVLEMSGDPAALMTAFELAAPGARIVAFSGYPPGSVVEMPVNQLHYEGLSLLGSYHYAPGRFATALALLASGKVTLNGILTHRLSLADAVRAPEISADPDCVSLVIEPHL